MGKYKIIPSSRTIVHSPISIGHKAEKGVKAIEFDLTAWVETYGSGTATIIMRRWGDEIPYPVALELDENNKATWTLSDIDTAKAGMAYAQLNYIVGDEVVKKSDIYTFRVMDSLTGEGEPPEAYDSWLEHLTHLAAEAMAEVLDIEGIVTDKTLTVDGGIADGKATGDALALKADKATTYTKTQVDQMIEDVEIETDTTLTIAGAAADAAETGRQIGLLKADLGASDKSLNVGLSNVENLLLDNVEVRMELEAGTYEDNGYADSTTRFRSRILPPGTYSLTAPDGYSVVVYKYVSDSQGTLYLSSRNPAVFTLAVPFVVLFRKSTSGAVLTRDDLVNIRDNGAYIRVNTDTKYINHYFTDGNLFDIENCVVGVQLGTDGTETASAIYMTTDYIYVGDVPYIYFRSYSRTVCYYDLSKNLISGIASNVSKVTLSDIGNVAYMRVSIASANAQTFWVSKKNNSDMIYGMTPVFGVANIDVNKNVSDFINRNNVEPVEKIPFSQYLFSGHTGFKSHKYTAGEEYSLYGKNAVSGSLDIRVTGQSISAVGIAEIKLYVYIPDASKITTLTCELSGTSNTRSFNNLTNGWNILSYYTYQGVLTTWETITGLRLTTTGTAGIELYLAKAEVIRPDKATIILVNDGAYKTFYDYIYDTLKTSGIPVTWALNPGRMGADVGTGRGRLMTEEEVLAISGDYCSEFSFHSWNPTVKASATMTAQEIRDDASKCVDYLRKKGLAPEHIWRAAHPQNTAPEYMAEKGIVEALATGTNLANFIMLPLVDKWNIPRILIHGRSDSEYDSIFDTLKKTHCGAVFYTHGVSSDSHDITEAQITYFVNKCVTGINEGWLNPTTYNHWVNSQ